MPPNLLTGSYTFDPRPNYPFLVTAKRYWCPITTSPTGLTLVFAHGTGFTKEFWEPTIDDLYELLAGRGDKTPKIREVWSIDCPNHGEAALLNEEALHYGSSLVFEWTSYGRAIHALLAGLGTGIDVDFSKHKLVGIGHSMGAVSIMASTTFHPRLKYAAIHLVEPMIVPPRMIKRLSFLEQGAVARRDIWPSREDSYRLFKSRATWKDWDDRVLRIFVDKGLRPLPTLEYPDKTEGVTLVCTKKQEAASYRNPSGIFIGYTLLPHLVLQVPTHIIYGAIDDHIPREFKDDVVYNASGGIDKLASLRRVEGTGHLIPQKRPKALAEALLAALSGDRGEVANEAANQRIAKTNAKL